MTPCLLSGILCPGLSDQKVPNVGFALPEAAHRGAQRHLSLLTLHFCLEIEQRREMKRGTRKCVAQPTGREMWTGQKPTHRCHAAVVREDTGWRGQCGSACQGAGHQMFTRTVVIERHSDLQQQSTSCVLNSYHFRAPSKALLCRHPKSLLRHRPRSDWGG